MWVKPLSLEDPLEECMATHSSFLPAESRGLRSLTSYSPEGRKELDVTKATEHMCIYIYIHIHTHTHTYMYITLSSITGYYKILSTVPCVVQ